MCREISELIMLEAGGMKNQKVGLISLMKILKYSETNRIISELL